MDERIRQRYFTGPGHDSDSCQCPFCATRWLTPIPREEQDEDTVWLATAGLMPDGTVMMPAATVGPEPLVFMAAMMANQIIMIKDDHVYIPADWVREHFPASADMANTIIRKMKSHLCYGDN